MEYSKETYLKVIASLMGALVLLILYISVQPPKIQTKEVEVVENKVEQPVDSSTLTAEQRKKLVLERLAKMKKK